MHQLMWRTGGVETPWLSQEVIEEAIGPLIEEWTQAGLGFKLSNEADEEEIVFTHKVWADNLFLFSDGAEMGQYMVDTITAVLLDNWDLAWKPNSLQAMYGYHVPKEERCGLTAVMLFWK